jgi:thiol-disulfide isomerase/thioredoxin
MKPMRKIIFFFLFLFFVGCANTNYRPATQLEEVNGEKILLGEIQYPDILYHLPSWFKADSESETSHLLTEQVKKIETPLQITCYLGTWCGDSREGVPPFVKTIEAVKNKNIRLKLIGVDRKKLDPENTAVQYNIQRVPTFIVFQDGQEIGRMVEFPLKENFVEDLLDIVNMQ